MMFTGCTSHQPAATQQKFKAELDTSFNKGSGIASITLNDEKVKELTNLGMLWGFIKYYHANVRKGAYNMDAALFRVLPKIMAAQNEQEANKVMEQWVDGFGVPDVCKDCKDLVKADSIKLMPDFGYLFIEHNLPQTLMDKLTYIKHNRYRDTAYYYVGQNTEDAFAMFKHEIPYSESDYPDCGIRLLALYRYWNMVQYFFPDRHLIGADWSTVLTQMIPEFCKAPDALAYQLCCLKLAASIHDTHAYFDYPDMKELEAMKGKYHPTFITSFVEDKLIVSVTECSNNISSDKISKNILKGDVIVSIGSISVDSLIKKYTPFVPASNRNVLPQYLEGSESFLLRSHDSELNLTISRDGKIITQTVPCFDLNLHSFWTIFPDSNTSSYKLINKNIGYIYSHILKKNDLDSIKIKFKDTKGIIFDMRTYPAILDMHYSYGAWLKCKKSPFAIATIPDIDNAGSFDYTDPLVNGDTGKDCYKGKVILIVNSSTQSLGELVTMALSTAPNAKVIGSTTAGADGHISEIVLPGNVKTRFSGVGILYPDSTETQRVGVKIDKVVRPTIKGIREGRDELLEEAVKMIESKN